MRMGDVCARWREMTLVRVSALRLNASVDLLTLHVCVDSQITALVCLCV